MVKKRIVCLANSRMRRNGYKCIAGKDIASGDWIRPVVNKSEAGLSWDERRYEDGSDPKVLDVIEVPLLGSYPHGCHHSENWLLDSGDCLKRASKPFLIKQRALASVVSDDCLRRGRITWYDLAELVDDPEELWGGEDVYGDRVEVDRIGKYSHSLYLIKLQSMMLMISWGKVRGEFSYHNNNYDFVVTDPEVENCIKKSESQDLNTLEPWQRILLENGKLHDKYSIGECYVTVSLTANPYKDHYYKLIAALITPERAGE